MSIIDNYNLRNSIHGPVDVELGECIYYEETDAVIEDFSTKLSLPYCLPTCSKPVTLASSEINLPQNISLIESNIINSPNVAKLEPRFIVVDERFPSDTNLENVKIEGNDTNDNLEIKKKIKFNNSRKNIRFIQTIKKKSQGAIQKLQKSISSAYPKKDAWRIKVKSGKYYSLNEMLGQGSGGKVMKAYREKDDKLYACKEFTHNKTRESRRDYAKKVKTEYCFGKILNHVNIIETIDILFMEDCSQIKTIVEYCDYDLFSVVSAQMMSTREIFCVFKQIAHGVKYLHNNNIAHCDLKLDNCAINSKGIVKIIDFGAAVIFNYNNSSNIINASGIHGSDPYLSPEVFLFKYYDPRPLDIWSLAIILMSMFSQKFPWKTPRITDKTFKKFVSNRNCTSMRQLIIGNYKKTTINHLKLTSCYESLPESSHKYLCSMLELSPINRINIDDLLKHEQIKKLQCCTLDDCENEDVLNSALLKNHFHAKLPENKSHIGNWAYQDPPIPPYH